MTFPTLPPDENAGLMALATFSHEQVGLLSERLGSAKTILDRDAFVASIEPIPAVDPVEFRRVVGAVLLLSSYGAAGVDGVAPKLAKDVAESLPLHDSEARARLERHLTQLLSIGSVRLRAKAVDLVVDHANTFQNARIVTDIRPVFSPSSAGEVAGAVVYHTLKIEYFGGRESTEIFFALDDRDLALLKEALERAETKARTVRAILQRVDLDDFGASEESK